MTRVGSAAYLNALKAAPGLPVKKIETVLSDLGARLVDGNLQLAQAAPFDPAMKPCDGFPAYFADLVFYHFKSKDFPQDDLGRMVHQLRYYFDEHNIGYVRRLYKKQGMADADALAAYQRAELGRRKMKEEPARLHNRGVADGTHKKLLTPDFHSEFILAKNGSFVTQWDVLERDREKRVVWSLDHYKGKLGDRWSAAQIKMANTESFNYARKNDAMHTKLDMDPAAWADPAVRSKVKKNLPAKSREDYKY